MVTGADIKAGYGQKKEKPFNSILPYLRAKEAEKVVKVSNERKAVKSPEDEYNDARREILREAEDE